MQLLENYLVEIEYHTIYGNLMRSEGGGGRKDCTYCQNVCTLNKRKSFIKNSICSNNIIELSTSFNKLKHSL